MTVAKLTVQPPVRVLSGKTAHLRQRFKLAARDDSSGIYAESQFWPRISSMNAYGLAWGLRMMPGSALARMLTHDLARLTITVDEIHKVGTAQKKHNWEQCLSVNESHNLSNRLTITAMSWARQYTITPLAGWDRVVHDNGRRSSGDAPCNLQGSTLWVSPHQMARSLTTSM